jgi:hypothetical protein
MNVSHEREKVGVGLHQEGLVSAAKEMPLPAVPRIECLGIRRLPGLHDPCEGSVASLDREMRVSAHQAVRKHTKPEAIVISRQQVQVPLAIIVVTKNSGTIVSLHDDVMEGTREIDARRSRHIVLLDVVVV